MGELQGYAAVFVDFENIFYHLNDRLKDADASSDAVVDLVRALRDQVKTDRGKQCIVQHAYADFDRITASAQGSLFLIGVDTHNVLGTDHKNAADMRLCIDALEVLYTRKEIETFVLVAGDRDYIPLTQHLRKHARDVLVCSFRSSLSGDLLLNVGDENFYDATGMLAPSTRDRLDQAEKEKAEAAAAAVASASKLPAATFSRPAPAPVRTPAPAPAFANSKQLTDEDTLAALEVLMEDYSQHPEVWLSPYLHALERELAHLADYERKAIINNLVNAGAVRIERRQSDVNEWSVLLINWEHPDVVAMNPG